MLTLLLGQQSPGYTQTSTPICQRGAELTAQDAEVSASSFPLNVWLLTTLDPYMIPTNFEEALGTFRWEVSGEGTLQEDTLRQEASALQLRFGNRPSLDSRRNFVEYCQSDVRLTLGEQRFSLSPLVRGGSGVGLDAERTVQVLPELNLGTRVLAYTGGDTGHLGVRLSVPFAQGEAAVNTLADLGDNALLSGQLRFSPAVLGLETLDFGAEYGLQFDDAPTRHALDLSANLAEGADSANVSYQQTEADYRGAPHDSSRLALDGNLRLAEVPTVDARMFLRREVARARVPPEDMFVHHTFQVGGTLAGDIGDVRVSLGYNTRNEQGSEPEANQQRDRLNFGVTTPFADELYLQQSLEWRRELVEGGKADDTLFYSAETDLLLLRGNVQPQVTVGYSLENATLNTFGVGAGWFALVTDTLDLYVSSGLYLTDETFGYFFAGGSYGLEHGQTLNLDVSVFLYDALEPLLELSLGYGFPVELPLGQQTAQDSSCCLPGP